MRIRKLWDETLCEDTETGKAIPAELVGLSDVCDPAAHLHRADLCRDESAKDTAREVELAALVLLSHGTHHAGAPTTTLSVSHPRSESQHHGPKEGFDETLATSYRPPHAEEAVTLVLVQQLVHVAVATRHEDAALDRADDLFKQASPQPLPFIHSTTLFRPVCDTRLHFRLLKRQPLADHSRTFLMITPSVDTRNSVDLTSSAPSGVPSLPTATFTKTTPQAFSNARRL